VVIISQKNFNDDMDKYLGKIRKSTPKSFSQTINFLKSKPDENVPEISDTETHVEYKEPSFFQKIFRWKRRYDIEDDELSDDEKLKLHAMEEEVEEIEDEEEQLHEMEEELEEKKSGILAGIMRMLGLYRRSPDELEDEFEEDFEAEPQPVIDEDVKEVLKITHSWITKLSPRYLKAFKASDDFVQYKVILEKYGLIKGKDEPVLETESKAKIQNSPKRPTSKK